MKSSSSSSLDDVISHVMRVLAVHGMMTFLFLAHHLDVGSQSAEFFVLSVFEIELVLRPETNLVQVVIQRLFRHLVLACGVLQSVSD